jgi:EpsI family protein
MPKLDRQTLTTYGPIAAAVAIMAVTCGFQGRWSERWGTFPELDLYAEQLNQIPKQVGEWQGQDQAGSDEKIRKISGAVGELMRTYRNANGDEVRVSIICARQRDIFYHTPERCYPAAGFDMQGDPQQVAFEIGNTEAQFFTTSFLKSEPTGTHAERGYWSWTGDGHWVAPRNPKVEFAGERALYKLYVFATIPPGSKGQNSSNDFCADFIRSFIPVATEALKPAMEKAGRIRAAESQGEVATN